MALMTEEELAAETPEERKARYRSIAVFGDGFQYPDNKVKEGRDDKGDRFKATTDHLNNTVTERAGDRQDVSVRPQVVSGALG